jgi:hypothetical protein
MSLNPALFRDSAKIHRRLCQGSPQGLHIGTTGCIEQNLLQPQVPFPAFKPADLKVTYPLSLLLGETRVVS